MADVVSAPRTARYPLLGAGPPYPPQALAASSSAPPTAIHQPIARIESLEQASGATGTRL